MSNLPWTTERPLMLAPMQGLTNRALRAVYGEHAKPDVLFTEFVRVRPKAKKIIADSDFIEATTGVSGIPLVVQVIGCADDGVVDAVRDLVARGVEHINVNMGCPFGRMTSVLAGGGMFKYPETVYPMLAALREIVPGSLSVKTRLGIDDKREIFSVFDSFSRANIDFLIIHSRTVKQKYQGEADAAFDKAAEIDEHNWEAWIGKAVLYGYSEEARYERVAVQVLVPTIQAQEQDRPQAKYAYAYLVLGDVYARLGDSDKAKQVWQQGLLLHPQNMALKTKVTAKN